MSHLSTSNILLFHDTIFKHSSWNKDQNKNNENSLKFVMATK